MVTVEEIKEETPKEIPASQERLLDAEAIEDVAKHMNRVSARMHLEGLAKKLRKESEALKRMEKSRELAEESSAASLSAEGKETEEEPLAAKSQPPAAPPKPVPATTPPVSSGMMFVSIDRFSFDAGGYNAPFVTVYAPLPNVGSIDRDNISCDFKKSSFDLIVKDLNGKSYRLFKDNLEKDIDPEKSKLIVKADKVVVKLAKIKSEYGSYDYWSKLVDNKRKTNKDGSQAKDDPHKSIMQLMKDMYDEGDDQMKKVIGETMMKQRRGDLDRDFGKGLDDLGDL